MPGLPCIHQISISAYRYNVSVYGARIVDLRQLRYFLAIVEEGSFTRAAQRVNVAQPALSLHVRNMEEALGTPLLLRAPQGVTATEAGELLARRARTLLMDLERTEEDLRSLGREPTGTVRLGLPGTISGILSVPLIARCRARYPKIKIVIAEAMSGFVREWLLDGGVDLAVLYAELREAGVRSEPLLDEELVMLAPPAQAGAGPTPLDHLAGIPLILPSGAHGLRTMLEEKLRVKGISVAPDIEVDSYSNIKRLVEQGYGCSVLPFHAVAQEASAGRLSVSPFDAPGLWRRTYLAHTTARPLTRAASAVSEILTTVSAELIADGTWAGAQPIATKAADTNS